MNYKNKKILRQMVRHRAPDNFQVQGVFNSSFLKASNLLLFCTTVYRSVCTHIIFDIYFQEYLICNNSLQHSSMFYRLCATWVSHFRRTLDNLINKILNNTSVKFEGPTGILNRPQKKIPNCTSNYRLTFTVCQFIQGWTWLENKLTENQWKIAETIYTDPLSK